MRNNIQVIDACLQLNNFIVDYREDNKEVTAAIALERMGFKDDYNRILSINPTLENYGVQGDSEEAKSGGRPSIDECQSLKTEIEIHNNITSNVKENNYTRPKSNWYRDNNHFVAT